MKRGKAKALMTVKDRTQKVNFKYKYKKKEDAYVGKFTFDRTQFGMTYGSGSFFKGLGDKVISDEVKVAFKIKLKKEMKIEKIEKNVNKKKEKVKS